MIQYRTYYSYYDGLTNYIIERFDILIFKSSHGRALYALFEQSQ